MFGTAFALAVSPLLALAALGAAPGAAARDAPLAQADPRWRTGDVG